MDMAALRTEFLARGFSSIDASGTTRQDAYINRAYYEICEDADWPFLEATTSGAAPLAVSDLRTIETVIDSTTKTRLSPLDRRHILETDYQLSTTGSPTHYYLTSGTTVAVYPANTTDTIAVRYWKVPTILTTGTTPVIPTRFHNLIVDRAVALAYLDADNAEMYAVYMDLFGEGLAKMRESLLVGQHDRADDFIVLSSGSEDW